MGSTRVNDIYMIIKPFASDLTFDSLDESFSTRMTAFQQCCEGLRHVHSCGIIHRDIKPANILIAKREPLLIILADFGHSTMQMESQDHMRGTLSYLPPEIVEMKEKGPTDGMYWSQACDVFSLGVVGYELFHGRFERVKQKKWIDEAIRTGLTETLTRSGRNIDKLLISMLSRDNTKRPSASQILDVYFPAKSQTDDVEHKRKHDAI
jgi:serine/threonine protein kinase